jgi:hypothetical protein
MSQMHIVEPVPLITGGSDLSYCKSLRSNLHCKGQFIIG